MITMKGQVEYKLPKKMKKRRQLDALVDSVKLPRSRKNSASAQDLLDCHSDSSEIDEFTIPQTGTKKRRCCICQSIAARIGLFMVTMACLTTCVGLIWVQWHIRHELNSLRKQINSVQSSETVPPEVMKIKSQLADVNKSVTNIKIGPGGLQEMSKTVIDIKQELKELQDISTRLQASVSASQNVLGLPAKINALSSTLATLGSDFKDFMGAQTSKYASLDNRMSALETGAKEVIKEPVSEIQISEMLSQELMHYNKSLLSGFQNINQLLEQQSARISTLEEFTSHSQSLKPECNSTEISEIVTKLLQREVDKTEFQEFKSELWKTFRQLNNTVHMLTDEYKGIVGKMNSHEATVTDLTTTVAAIQKGEGTHSTTSSPVRITMPADSTASAVKSEPSDKPVPVADLVRAFNDSPYNRNKQLDLDAVNDLTKKTINIDDLKQFDLDGNGVFSEDELARALSFQKNPR